MAQRGKNLPANAGDTADSGSAPGSGRCPEEGNDNPPQYSWLENMPRTEGPGELQSRWLKRVGHDRATKQWRRQGLNGKLSVWARTVRLKEYSLWELLRHWRSYFVGKAFPAWPGWTGEWVQRRGACRISGSREELLPKTLPLEGYCHLFTLRCEEATCQRYCLQVAFADTEALVSTPELCEVVTGWPVIENNFEFSLLK